VGAEAAEGEPGPDRSVRNIAVRQIVFDRDGFLVDFEDWSEELFECLAQESGLPTVGDQQWRVIRFLRSYYAYHRRAPLHRQLKEGMGMSVLEMEGLFPDGLKRGARRLAGLPNPRTC
jgi:dissimilatory sulfite reductase related protein